MKKLLSHKVLIAFFIIAFYIFWLVAGIAVITFSHIENDIDNYERTLDDAVESYISTGEIKLFYSNTTVMIFSKTGEMEKFVHCPDLPIPVDLEVMARHDLPGILAGNETGNLSFYARPLDRLWEPYPEESKIKGIQFVLGKPFEHEGQTKAGVFIQDLYPLDTMYSSYIAILTTVVLVGVLCALVIVRKNREIETIRREYVANVTHELKTPITSAKALVETLSDGFVEDEESQTRYYGIILDDLNQLERMVCEMLEISKVQSGSVDFSKSKVSFDDTFGRAIEKYRVLCDELCIELRIDEDLSSLPPLYTNAKCAARVMEVLLDNAVKFVEEGDSVSISAITEKSHVTFCVADTGIGIDKEQQKNVFKRFYKCADNERQGSGLGLAIAQETLAGLKEKIWVESSPGAGASFFFTISLSK